MTNLVENKNGEVYADSALIARKFGMKHNKLTAVIEGVFTDYPDLRVVQIPLNLQKNTIQKNVYIMVSHIPPT